MSAVNPHWLKYRRLAPIVAGAAAAVVAALVWSTPWPAAVLITGREPLNGVRFSPDGSALASRDVWGFHKVWDVTTGRLLEERGIDSAPDWFGRKRLTSPDGRISGESAFSRGGRPQTDLALVDVATGETLCAIVAHPDQLNAFAFSPDGRFLATGGGYTDHPWPVNRAGDARIWDVRTGKLLHVLGWHWGAVAGVDFSPDGKTLATACYDGVVRLWRIR